MNAMCTGKDAPQQGHLQDFELHNAAFERAVRRLQHGRLAWCVHGPVSLSPRKTPRSQLQLQEDSFRKGRVRGHMMWLTHHSQICPGKERARPHDVSAAPHPDLHLLLNDRTRSTRTRRRRGKAHHDVWGFVMGPGIVGLDAKAIGPRPALTSLESVVGLSLKHAPSPALRIEENAPQTYNLAHLTTVQLMNHRGGRIGVHG